MDGTLRLSVDGKAELQDRRAGSVYTNIMLNAGAEGEVQLETISRYVGPILGLYQLQRRADFFFRWHYGN